MEILEGRYHDDGLDLIVKDENDKTYVVCASAKGREISLSKENGIIKDKKVSIWKNIFIAVSIFCIVFMITSCILKEVFNDVTYNYLIFVSIFSSIGMMISILFVYAIANKKILAKHAATHMALNYIEKNNIPKTLDDVAQALREIEKEDKVYDYCFISDFMAFASFLIFSSIIFIFDIPLYFVFVLLFVNYKIHNYLWKTNFFNFIQSTILYAKPSKTDLILALSAVSFSKKDNPFSEKKNNNTDSSRDNKN